MASFLMSILFTQQHFGNTSPLVMLLLNKMCPETAEYHSGLQKVVSFY